MATSELAHQALSRNETRLLSSNARFYAPDGLRLLLRKISCAPELAFVLDVVALRAHERTRSDVEQDAHHLHCGEPT
jgi:hypothetical protein